MFSFIKQMFLRLLSISTTTRLSFCELQVSNCKMHSKSVANT